jgi:hypothetical protein
MSYFSELDIDTRTCGQADEDAWLDRRDGIVTRARVFSSLAADRHAAQMAARPQVSDKDQATQLFHCMKAAIADGRMERARELALELKPLLGFLKGEE